MGYTSSRRQAILELVTKLKTDQPTDLERLSTRFKELEQNAGSARNRLKLLVGGLKEESIEISKATQKNLDHAKVLNGVAVAADNASKKLNFYNQAVRDSYSSQGQMLKGRQSAPAGGGRSGGGINVERGLTSIGALLPGQAGNAARAAADFAQLAEEIGKFSQASGIAVSSIGKATPALAGLNTGIAGLAAGGLAAVALAALALAVQKFIKDIQDAQQALTSATDAQVRYYELIKTGTSEEIQLELQRAQVAKEAREAVLAQLEVEQARLGIFGQIAKIFGIGPAKEIERLGEEIEKLNFQIDPLQRALGSSEVKARDAARAAQEAAEHASKQAQETDRATVAVKKAAEAQTQLAQKAEQLAAFYDTLNQSQQSAVDTQRQAEYNLAQERIRIFADYAQRIQDQERQSARDRAREQRRADFDRLIALKQRELSEFDLLLRGDFAGVASLRREAQAQDEVDRFRGEFEAQEAVIAAREQDYDNQLSLQRQLAELTSRTRQEQLQAGQQDLGLMRQRVAEWFKIQGYMGNVNQLTEQQIRYFYQIISQLANAPRLIFGAPLGGGAAAPSAGAPSAPRPTVGTGAFGGGGGGFTSSGGFNPTVTQNNNFYGNSPTETARAVDTRLRRLIGGG